MVLWSLHIFPCCFFSTAIIVTPKECLCILRWDRYIPIPLAAPLKILIFYSFLALHIPHCSHQLWLQHAWTRATRHQIILFAFLVGGTIWTIAKPKALGASMSSQQLDNVKVIFIMIPRSLELDGMFTNLFEKRPRCPATLSTILLSYFPYKMSHS